MSNGTSVSPQSSLTEPSTAGGVSRGRWAWWVWMLMALAGCAIFLPLDGWIARQMNDLKLGGDIRRTFETLQQFGDVGTLIITGLFIWLLDERRRIRLWDMAAASGLTALACQVLKMTIGRPRPSLHAPLEFLLPWGTFPITRMMDGGIVTRAMHAWELSHRAQLWSMPSSHTAAAAALAVFLAHQYPKVKPLVLGLVILTALARVLLHAHYPTDTIIGALVGFLVSRPVVSGAWASRWIAARTSTR